MAQRRKLSSKVATIDLTNEEPFALLGNDILKEIAKNLGPSDLARLGIADRRLRDVSSIQMAEILADPKLVKRLPLFRARFLSAKRLRNGRHQGLATASGALCGPPLGQLTTCNRQS